MISKFQKEILQKHLKKDWVPEVLDKLEQQKVVSSKGTAYSESMVRMVFIGKIEHQGIEQAIFDVFEARMKAFDAFEMKKLKILNDE